MKHAHMATCVFDIVSSCGSSRFYRAFTLLSGEAGRESRQGLIINSNLSLILKQLSESPRDRPRREGVEKITVVVFLP
jgi:hypothetical protein